MPSVAVTATASAYRRHRPEQTTLFAIVAEHYPRFIEAIEASGGRLPAFVRQEFEDYLKCGLLEHGFLARAGITDYNFFPLKYFRPTGFVNSNCSGHLVYLVENVRPCLKAAPGSSV